MEKELFEPIKNYFENYGYVCDGEVKDIDLYMEKEGSSVAIELKQTLDFKALQQAALRQKITDYVYIGTFKPKDMYSHSFKDKLYVLKRLGIGLIVVSKRSKEIEIVSEPIVSELSSFQQRNKGKKLTLATEFQKRKLKKNTGGVTGVKLMTSYREEALLVLDALMMLGQQGSTKAIRTMSDVKNTTSILYNNYYNWFAKVDRGIYKVTDEGIKAYEEYSEVIAKLKRQTNEQCH
ncbi:MAG: hypothetical protein HUJ56_13615 [Erysipelotrichaceae bacterium]|nr:hypothetical protein [Erysipelotrichaceae bacterium]